MYIIMALNVYASKRVLIFPRHKQSGSDNDLWHQRNVFLLTTRYQLSSPGWRVSNVLTKDHWFHRTLLPQWDLYRKPSDLHLLYIYLYIYTIPRHLYWSQPSLWDNEDHTSYRTFLVVSDQELLRVRSKFPIHS